MGSFIIRRVMTRLPFKLQRILWHCKVNLDPRSSSKHVKHFDGAIILDTLTGGVPRIS
jgi:hypothetical protein